MRTPTEFEQTVQRHLETATDINRVLDKYGELTIILQSPFVKVCAGGEIEIGLSVGQCFRQLLLEEEVK